MSWSPHVGTDTFPPVTHAPEKLGIIAGNRSLPLVLAREARADGVLHLVAAAFENETDPALADLVDTIEWLRVGQLSKLIELFKKQDISRCVMVGQIAPKNLFDLRPDLRTVKLLASLKDKNAHSIFGAIADELEKEGITLIEATPWLEPAMPQAGFCLGPSPSKNQLADIEFGRGIAKEISRLEIGQTVVVKNGTVLAVEGFEGTDACLTRGGKLAGDDGGAVYYPGESPAGYVEKLEGRRREHGRLLLEIFGRAIGERPAMFGQQDPGGDAAERRPQGRLRPGPCG